MSEPVGDEIAGKRGSSLCSPRSSSGCVIVAPEMSL
jgi:hypothetical protein